MTSSRGAPDLFGTDPIIGYRIWHLDRFAVVPELRSVIYADQAWPARQRLTATCCGHQLEAVTFACPLHVDPAPQLWCDCGIHLGERSEDALRQRSGYDTLVVRGQASLWGRVIRCDRGWRGEFAYPYSLEIEPNTIGDVDLAELRHLAGRVTDRYGVECTVQSSRADRAPQTRPRDRDHPSTRACA